MKQIKIYVGCSLTQAPEIFKDDVAELKRKLKQDYEIMEFIGLEKGTATDVYHWDVQNNVGTCDLFVAICDLPSLGLGYELASAIEHYHKPVLAVAHKDAKITRLVLGIDAPGFSFERYDHIGDVVELVHAKAKAAGLAS